LELLRHRRRGGGRRGGFSMATGMDRARATGACSPWGRRGGVREGEPWALRADGGTAATLRAYART